MLRRPASQLDMYCLGTQQAVMKLNLYGTHVMQGLMQKKFSLLLVVLCFY